jgi:hypothetical protein
MAKKEDLVAAGIITDLGNGKYRFDVPLEIPGPVIDGDGFEKFAKKYGWTEQVESGNLDGDGNPIMIDNPQAATDKGISVIRDFAWSVLEAAEIEHATKQAKDAVVAGIAALRDS